MKRHNSRIMMMLKLVEYHFDNGDDSDLFGVFELDGIEYDHEYYEKLSSIFSEIDKIDEIISTSLTNYTIDRLSKVDLSILEVATFELVHLKEAKAIVIDEALEITKEYSDLDGKQVKFNNRLLDEIARRCEGGK